MDRFTETDMANLVAEFHRECSTAFINEVSFLCQHLGLDPATVLKEAGRGHPNSFRPGYGTKHIALEGIYSRLHRIPTLLRTCKDTNAEVTPTVVNAVINSLWRRKLKIEKSHVLVCGLSNKEDDKNCQFSAVGGLLEKLRDSGCHVIGYDPLLAYKDPIQPTELGLFDAVVIAVAHTVFAYWTPDLFRKMSKEQPCVFDIQRLYDRTAFEMNGVTIWQM